MRITLRWGRNREPQFVAFLGGGGVRPVHFDCVWHHPAQFDQGTGAIRALLLCHVCRGSFRGGMGHGVDSAVGEVIVGRTLLSAAPDLAVDVAMDFPEITGSEPDCPLYPCEIPATSLRRALEEDGRLPRADCVPAARIGSGIDRS